ncbi:hypothetical protein F4781DRAFT_78586 [Annulohypoxylon bovei var. microspora]|nr:hypothetical protein F4781DRAFT_78586 [Annulohypoxylon bovei var. microspora]
MITVASLARVIMATRKEKPIKSTRASRSGPIDSPEEHGEWHEIELGTDKTGPNNSEDEWEHIYRCAADPHAVDFYDDSLVENPVEDGWMSVTQIQEQLQDGSQKASTGDKPTQTPAGLGNKTKRWLAKQRNAKAGPQQVAARDSSKDGATMAGTKSRTRNGDIADQHAPTATVATTTETTTETTTKTTTETRKSSDIRLCEVWRRAILSRYPPPSTPGSPEEPKPALEQGTYYRGPDGWYKADDQL